MIEPYVAALIQPELVVAKTRDDIMRNLDRYCKLIDFTVGYFWEHPCKLIAFPEYFMQGVTTPGKGEKQLGGFMDVAIEIPGPEINVLAEKAREYGIYIAGGGIVERLPEWPDRWFNTGVIIGPDGDVILKYHKWHVPAFIGLGTSPHDILDEYGPIYGSDIKSLFPVVDTDIGKLGIMICHDGHSPEVSRALAYNGAEVIIRCNAMQEIEGVSDPWDSWTFTTRTRAHDNCLYIVAANWGSVDYDYYPKAFCPGRSLIVDYYGNIMRQADYPAEGVIGATIDIEALRKRRGLIWHNLWADLRTEGFREIYQDPLYPPNLFPPDKPPRTLSDKMEGALESLRILYERGTFTPPSGLRPEDMPGELIKRIERAQESGALRKKRS
jgi:predicted amidohydrolase